MAKKPIRWIKLTTTGFAWFVVYLGVMWQLGLYLFNFNPLLGSQWAYCIRRFLTGEWVIDTFADFLLFLFMLLFLPLLLGGWWMVYHVHWSRLIPVKKGAQKVLNTASRIAVAKRSNLPQKMRVQSNALLSVSLAQAQQQVAQAQTQMPAQPQPNSTPQPQQPAAAVQFADEVEVQDMMDYVAALPVEFYPHVALNGHYASFAISTDKKAAVFTIINRAGSQMAADLESPAESADWFYETGILPAPAKDIIPIAASLQENEADSIAVPVILLMNGALMNAPETLDYYRKNNVFLVRMELFDAPDIPLFSDFICSFFELDAVVRTGEEEDTPAPIDSTDAPVPPFTLPSGGSV